MRVSKLLTHLTGFILFLLLSVTGRGQSCSAMGQNPSTAFPICNTFNQTTVPQCGGRSLPVPCPDAGVTSYSDINPFWYKFICYSPGTLGFLITPNDLTDDYDWQLFDITGHNANDVYTNSSLFVSGNWSAHQGVTGAAAAASGDINCAGDHPNQNAMPVLKVGHTYLLLVSHYTQTQSGYTISFEGGSAVITNDITPGIDSIQAVCDGDVLAVFMNKPVTCASLAADGSDFLLTASATPGRKVIGAYMNSCVGGFDGDTVYVQLNGSLLPGSYTLSVQKGSDGNTLLDDCAIPVPAGDYSVLLKTPLLPTPMDSLTTPGCAPNVLQLVFKKNMVCSSIDADGSDFYVTGTSGVSVIGASGQCSSSGQTHIVTVQLSAPIQQAGSFQIHLQKGVDGNTLIDECGLETPAGSFLSFTTGDTVYAGLFTDKINLGCVYDTIQYDYPVANGVNSWQWVLDGSDTVRTETPHFRVYSVFGEKPMQLIVSNGYCSDTISTQVNLDNAIKAIFEAPNIICPTDYAHFIDSSTGNLNSWAWDFGDGTTNQQAAPPDHLYPLTGVEQIYTIRLIVGNALGCYDTAIQKTDVLKSCYIAVPTAFTPNGDGLNDYLYPLNAFKADGLVFRVYNRIGQMVYQSNDWTKKWDGRVKGDAQPAGTYVWYLEYTDRDTGKHIFQKGTTVLIR